MKSRGKERHPKEVVYGALLPMPFDVITVTANQTTAALQARFPLGFDAKIYRVLVVAGGAINVTSFNICVGSAVEGALVSDDVSDFGNNPPSWTFNTTSGLKLFTADQNITNTADLVQTFNCSTPEAVFQQGTELSLRIVSGAGGAGTLKVVMYGKFIDTKMTKPMANATPAALNLATDL